jgi:hypothetical protein
MKVLGGASWKQLNVDVLHATTHIYVPDVLEEMTSVE